MATKSRMKPFMDIRRVIETVGLEQAINQVGLERIIYQIGLERALNQINRELVIKEGDMERLLDEKGVAWFVNQMSPKLLTIMKKRLDQEDETGACSV